MAKIRFIPANATRQEWSDHNPVPLAGEICIENDTGLWKFGDGTRAYVDLPYAQAPKIEVKNGNWTIDGFDTGIPMVGEGTAARAEIDRQAAEAIRTESEKRRNDAEKKRESEEAGRKKLLVQFEELVELFDENPNSVLAYEVKRLLETDDANTEKMLAVAHNIDNGKDLVKQDKKLYRGAVEIRDNAPFLVHKEVGDVVTNDVVTYTFGESANKVRLYFKIQGTAEGNVLAVTEDEKYKLVIPVSNKTRHCSREFEFAEGDSKTLNLLCFTAYGQEIKVWDYDEREVV